MAFLGPKIEKLAFYFQILGPSWTYVFSNVFSNTLLTSSHSVSLPSSPWPLYTPPSSQTCCVCFSSWLSWLAGPSWAVSPSGLKTTTMQDTCFSPNQYTRQENLAWSHSVFWQFSFFRKCRFMKPLLLFSVDTFHSLNQKYKVYLKTDAPPSKFYK